MTMSHRKTRVLQLFFVVAILFFMVLDINVSYAQQGFWTQQTRIPEYIESAHEPPYLIADKDHLVHAINSQPLVLGDETSSNAIVYRQWTPDGGWTSPNDIFYDGNGGNLDVVNAISDENGMVYLIFQRDFQDIYFSRTTIANIGDSFSWSSPILIARKSTHIGTGFDNIGAIVATANGLVVVYSGFEYGNGLYYVFSSDQGDTWSRPYPIYLAGTESLVVTDPALFFGESGKLHSVWCTFNDDGSGGPGYYASFDFNTKTWSDPQELDMPGIRTPSVIEYDGDIFVSYYHASTNGNWWRRSSDAGNTWTNPAQLTPIHVGTNGRISFVVDSDNTLQGFFGERINDLNHGMWNITWTGSSWTRPSPIVKGPQVRDLTGGTGFDPRSARAIVSSGNLILVTWTTDGFAGENGAWYSYRWLDTPMVNPAFPEIASVATENVISTLTGSENSNTVFPSPTPGDAEFLKSPDKPVSPQIVILAGVAPAILFLLGFLIIKYIQTRNN